MPEGSGFSSPRSKEGNGHTKRAAGCIGRILRNKVPRRWMQQVLLGKVAPVFLYGLTVTYPRNRSDQISLERLNRFLLRLSTNNHTAPYTDLLNQSSSLSVCQSVLHRRINLVQRYSKGLRYQPERTIQDYEQQPRFRDRFHAYALAPGESTGIKYRDSALETMLQLWNRVPNDLIRGNSLSIGKRLQEASYGDTSWGDFTAVQAALLTL